MKQEKIPNKAPAAGHSEDYFGGYRDFCWNTDSVALLAKRQGCASCRRVLEVGCGAGHWARVLTSQLIPGTELTCLDRDPKWSDPKAAWAAAIRNRGIDLKILPGDAMQMPFLDGTFDFVTCQTLLIHLARPQQALAEMVRVLEPGGLLSCVEPDNFASFHAETSLSRTDSLEDDVAAYRFSLARARGRIARGLGNLSLGGRLPGMFAAARLDNVTVCLSDKALPLCPPYERPEQAALISDIEKWHDSGRDFAKEEMRQNYLAGGGDPADFEAHWARELAGREKFRVAIRERTYDGGGGMLSYIVSGRKPASPS